MTNTIRPQITLYAHDVSMPSREHHDYDPAWDYEFGAAPRGEQATGLTLALNAAADDLLGPLGFPGAVAFLAKKGGLGPHTLGKYADGTTSYPVIGLDLPSINAACRKTGNEFVVQVKATLAHELGHAWLDARCGEDDLIDDEEEIVEAFAYEWVVYGDVRMDILERALPANDHEDAPAP